AAARRAARARAGTNIMTMLREAMSAYDYDSCDEELRNRQRQCKRVVVQVLGTGEYKDAQGYDGIL
ncbi:unnamed protein product, partial [Prorocentrum cordatum]